MEALKVVQCPRSWLIASEVKPPEHPLVGCLCLLESLVDLITVLSLRDSDLDQSVAELLIIVARDHVAEGIPPTLVRAKAYKVFPMSNPPRIRVPGSTYPFRLT